ncbi:MAG: right-handed parallel beta-helix repeat-containing protein [Actinomycetota bacterium]|nr:right-handed parallel beta-helix repeat-containing protein [Actinomycetota bacterium]
MRANPRLAAIAMVLFLLASACSGSDSTVTTISLDEDCHQRAIDLVDEAQRFVDQFAQTAIADIPAGGVPGLQDVDTRLQAARVAAQEAGCTPEMFDGFMAEEVDRLEGKGPVGRPLAAAMRGIDPSTAPARNVTIDPAADLAGVLFEAGAGSVIALGAGTYELDELVIIERPISLVGAGAETTVIRSSVGGAVIYYSADGDLEIAALTIEHIGAEPGSVIVAAGGSLSLREVRLSGGAVDPATGIDGHGLALASTGDSAADAARIVTLTGSKFDGNDRIGVAVFGSVEVAITASEMHDNGFCGACFMDDGKGIVSGNTVIRNQIGIGAGGSSTPSIRDNEITGNEFIGLLIEDDAAPIIEKNNILDNVESGIEITGSSIVRVKDNEIAGHVRGVSLSGETGGKIYGNVLSDNDVGILLAGSVTPIILNNRIEGTGGAAVSVGGEASGRFVANTLRGHDVGIQVVGRATPVFIRNEIVADGGTGILLGGASGAVFRDTIVSGHDIGIQAGADAVAAIDGSIVNSVTGTGIAFTDAAAGPLSNNTVTGHDVGIQVSGTAVPTIVGGTVTGAAIAGVIYAGTEGGSVTGLAVENTDIGFLVGEEARPEVVGNTISEIASVGIIYREAGAGIASENDLSGIGAIGIQVGDTAAPALDGNTIGRGPEVGIFYSGNGGGSTTANSIAGSVGVQVGDQSRPTISANTIRSTGDVGVIFAGSSGGTFSRNTVRGAREVGVQVVGSASPSLVGNRVSAGSIGIMFGEDARGRATRNAISGVKVGVQAVDRSSPVVTGNTFSSITSSSVLFLGPVGGSISGNACPVGVAGIVTLSGAAPDIGENDCEVTAGF